MKFLAILIIPVSLLAATQDAAKMSPLANSDTNYRALRDGGIAESFTADNIVLKRDAGTLTLQSGEISFLTPVLGRPAVAVFTGRGRFGLKPAQPIEATRLQLISGANELDEEFDAALLYFTDATCEEIRSQAKRVPVSAAGAAELSRFRSQLRTRVDKARSVMEAELYGEDIPNLDEQVLADLYNPAHAGSFMALLHGRKHPQLRFLLRPQGALHEYGPEEVALINVDPAGRQDGVWYMAHTVQEIQGHSASSSEEKRLIAPEHYQMDIHVGHHDRLAAKAVVRFKALRAGDRLLGFSLLPNLRVSSVKLDGSATGFIQEDFKEDGALAVILPEPTVQDRVYTLEFEYEGNKVIFNEGGGNYSVEARENWYPASAAFRDYATFDITFHSPKKLTLVSVGNLVSEKREGDEAVTEWKSDEPLPVAGFNYGNFKRKEHDDEETKYKLTAFATADVPDWLKGATHSLLDDVGPHEGLASEGNTVTITPSAMADRVLLDALNSVRIFSHWYGPASYGRLAVTQQPAFSFGQSWPTLVYLPVSAFIDPTQRWQLLGRRTFGFSSEFVNVVTAHEVAHQWWGHMVGWASYHDQWLSEGIADFSAGLFLQATQRGSDAYLKFWESERRAILAQNEFGVRANDAGPLWLGQRLNWSKSQSAAQSLIYAKGAYVLQMLRSLMIDGKGDANFISMMHDFVTTYHGKCASTEDFQRIVEKHMTPDLDLDHNGRMDWFFKEWVYGTEVPSYRLEYALNDTGGGQTLLTMKISQQDVSPSFKMRVPVYLDYDGRLMFMGNVPMAGSSTTNDLKISLPKRPRRVFLNANNDVLASNVVQK
jgi:hypothetical protein